MSTRDAVENLILPAPIVRRRSLLLGSVAASLPATLGAPGLVHAQADRQGDWPRGPIKFVVPFPPGGSTDPVARFIQTRIAESTGWQILVDNKPGAAGAIGAAIAAKSAPDGQTWLVTFDSHILVPAFNPNPSYKDSDLLNVMLVGRAPLAIACHPDRPYRTFADAIADARKRPGQPTVGVLTASQALLLITHLKKENDFDANVIFYKGGAPTVQDLLAGVTDMALTTLAPLDPHFRAGKLRALATTGEQRTPLLPQTPTLAEQGIKGYPTYSWWGVYAPAGTPRPIVERMNAEIAKAVRSDEVAPKLTAQIGMEILATSPEAFASFQKVEQERWTRIIEENGIKAD
jgi:tripartite-type tricarboxylate transporter receptor subunit TctC